MPALLEPSTETNLFGDLIPKAPTDYGKFADLVPSGLKAGAAIAGQEDYGLFSDLVPKSPTSETEKAVADMPVMSAFDKNFQAAEKFVSTSTGIPFHESMNALRSLSAGAGKYIFEGLQGFEQNRAKMLANPPSELTKPQGDELILPDGSMMSKEQQDALEQRYHDAAIAQIPDAKARADYFKQVAENADTSQYVDPELAKTIPARIAHAAGSAGVMAVESMIPFAGIPFMVMHGAMATEAEAKNAGKTDAEAEAAGVRSAIGLALFGGASKLAALGVAKLLPDGASSVRTFLTQFIGQEAANETSSRAINAWESAADAPEGKKIEAALNALKDTTLEQSTLNTVYALAHATKAAGKEPVRPEAAPEPSTPLKTTEIPPTTAGEPIEQAPASEVLKPEPQPQGESNGPISQRSAETQIPRPTETGQDQPISSEGMGRSEQGTETAGAPQAQKEPIGVADAIAEIQRRNVPEPVQSGEQTGATTGISQARTEAELGKGSVEPGVGAELGSGLEYGRRYVNNGQDPRLPIRRALASGLVGKNEVGIVHAELERLRGVRDRAAREAEANPNNLEAQKALADADNAQRAWRKELQPVLTKASDALREAYAESAVPDVGTYEGLSNLVDEHFKGNLELSPEQRTALQKVSKTVRDARTETAKSVNDAVEVMAKRAKKIMTPDELRADLAHALSEEFADCVL